MEDRFTIRWTRFLFFGVSITFYFLLFILTLPYIDKDLDGYKIFWLSVAFLMILFFAITHVLLFVNYYKHDKGYELRINRIDKVVEIIKKSKVIKFKFDDISKVIVHQTYYASRGGKHVAPPDYFSYTEIHVNDGAKYVLTSLICDDLKLNLGHKETIEIRKLPLIKND